MAIRQYENFIDGRWTSDNAGALIDVIDPATEEVIGRALDGGTKQAVMAIEAARRAFDEGPWPWMSVRDRAKILKRFSEIMESRHDELRELIVSEIGSVHFLTDFLQVGGAIEASHYYSDFVEHDVSWVETPGAPTVSSTGLGGTVVVREPVGVVGVITPFNFPFSINLQKCLPALAVGCTVVLKPHPWTPMNALELARVGAEAGIPPGVFNVVVGGSEVGEELSTNPLVDMIAFTGSTATVKRIREVSARTMKRAQLELGGKSAHVVLDDVTESDVAGIGFGQVLMHSGQACVAASRLLLPEHLLDPYVEGVKAMVPNLTIGDPRDPATVVGPLIREQQRQRVEDYVQSALEEGATLVVGGQRPAHLSRGFFYEPTAFINCRNDMRICREEVFGPVLTVLTYQSQDEAIRIANDSDFGLAGVVMTRNAARGFNVARQIRTGTIIVQCCDGGPADPGPSPGNGAGPGWSLPARGMFNGGGPFGGFKHSGLGREQGRWGFEEFTEIKSISLM
ncbi:aldehyde dehydrogenase [Mycobacterium colombiense]|uniref:aldehyde dehydrogenase (NAD(+)) n=1 Tax=Mycobacterium colombiense TaxID=339268 RepID=A0A1A2SL30_9MYCO|nr:aldehyde dehydrogenase family protein [Mycobacterium colombiense]OBH64933.1 aldehyde dehydrogenase [Mycobacterium colombiense]